jgi:type I restriction enzyme M protein
VTKTYHAWRGEKDAGKYEDISGFCNSAKLVEIRKQGHTLTPGRYVGAEDTEDSDESFDDKMKRLSSDLAAQFKQSDKLEADIKASLIKLGYKI